MLGAKLPGSMYATLTMNAGPKKRSRCETLSFSLRPLPVKAAPAMLRSFSNVMYWLICL
jgi:hypothetical protein